MNVCVYICVSVCVCVCSRGAARPRPLAHWGIECVAPGENRRVLGAGRVGKERKREWAATWGSSFRLVESLLEEHAFPV